MDKRRYYPFILSAAVVAVDQISKALIVHFIPEGTVGAKLLGDFLWICHVRNDAVAFSLGSGLSDAVKIVAFVILPLILMVLIVAAIFSDRILGKITQFQRWCLAGIAGGGIGNLIDRVLNGVVVDYFNHSLFNNVYPIYNAALAEARQHPLSTRRYMWKVAY